MKLKRLLAISCTVVLTVGSLAGCGRGNSETKDQETSATSETRVAQTDSEAGEITEQSEMKDDLSEHVEITIGGIGLSNSDGKEGWPTEVVEKIQDKFNVTLKTKEYDNESLNLDLSGGTTCDIIQINDQHIEGVLKGKHAVNLEQYQDTLASNIFRDDMHFRNEVVKQFKSNGENTQYFVTPRVTFADTKANYGTILNNGYIVRWDLYKAIGSPEINNDGDYIAALKEMQALYPETEEGFPTYAMSVYNDAGLHAYFYKGCLAEGYVNLEGGNYVQNIETNEILPNYYDAENPDVLTPFWSGVKFYNELYREGLLDPDCFITKSEDINEKTTKGQYIGGSVNWYYNTYNENERAKDPETLKELVTLPSKLGWANEKNLAGWIGKYFFVSSHSVNVERAVMILDYLQSAEFSRDIDSGVEGRWEVADGKSALTEDTMDMKINGDRVTEWRKSGIDESSMAQTAGEDFYNFTEDGGRISLWYEDDLLADSMTYAQKDLCEELELSVPSDMLKKRVEAGTSTDLGTWISAIQVAMETTPKNIVRIDSNCVEITQNAVPSLVQAATDEEFEAAKAALIQELEAAGAQESADWWIAQWAEAKDVIENIK